MVLSESFLPKEDSRKGVSEGNGLFINNIGIPEESPVELNDEAEALYSRIESRQQDMSTRNKVSSAKALRSLRDVAKSVTPEQIKEIEEEYDFNRRSTDTLTRCLGTKSQVEMGNEYYNTFDEESIRRGEELVEDVKYIPQKIEFSEESYKALEEFIGSLTEEQKFEMKKSYIRSRGEDRL